MYTGKIVKKPNDQGKQRRGTGELEVPETIHVPPSAAAPGSASWASRDDTTRLDLERLVLRGVVVHPQHLAALEPQREPLRGGHLRPGHTAAQELVQLVRRAVRAAMLAVEPHTGGVPQLPTALDRDGPGRVEVELQLVLAQAHLDQLRAVQECEVQVGRDAVHAEALRRRTSCYCAPVHNNTFHFSDGNAPSKPFHPMDFGPIQCLKFARNNTITHRPQQSRI